MFLTPNLLFKTMNRVLNQRRENVPSLEPPLLGSHKMTSPFEQEVPILFEEAEMMSSVRIHGVLASLLTPCTPNAICHTRACGRQQPVRPQVRPPPHLRPPA